MAEALPEYSRLKHWIETETRPQEDRSSSGSACSGATIAGTGG